MATMKKMVAKKAPKKYNNGGELTMKDKTNTVVRSKDNTDILNREKDKSDNSSKSYNSEVTKSKDNSRMKSTTDNSVTNVDRSKVKYKIPKGATVNFIAKNGKTMKKAQNGVAANPRKGLTDKTQPVNSAGEVTTGMANPYRSKNGSKVMKKAKSGAKMKSGGSMKKCRYGCK